MTNKPTPTEPTAPWNDPAVKYDTPLPEAAWVAWASVALPVTVDVYNDEDPLAEPTKEKRLVPWNLTLCGSGGLLAACCAGRCRFTPSGGTGRTASRARPVAARCGRYARGNADVTTR